MLLLEKIQFLSSEFPFLSHLQVFSHEISPVGCLKYPYNYFSSHYCFLVIVVMLILVLFVLFLVAVISLSLFFFLWSLWVIILMNLCYHQCWQVLFLLFLTHIVCLGHLLDVQPYVSSLIFLFLGPFLEVFPLFTLRMVPSMLQGAYSFGEISAL